MCGVKPIDSIALEHIALVSVNISVLKDLEKTNAELSVYSIFKPFSWGCLLLSGGFQSHMHDMYVCCLLDRLKRLEGDRKLRTG